MVTMYIEMCRRHAHTQTHMLAQGVDTKDKERKEKIFRCRKKWRTSPSFYKNRSTRLHPGHASWLLPPSQSKKQKRDKSRYDGISNVTFTRQQCQNKKRKKKKRLSTPRANLALSSFPSFLQDNTPPVAGCALFPTK